MSRFILVCLVSSFIILGACSKDHQDLPTSFVYDPPPTPTNFEVVGGNESAILTWSYPANEIGSLDEFRIYYHYEIYNMIELIGTTADTTFIDSLLVGNLYYCYQVSAVDTTGFEGWRTTTECTFVRSAE